MNTRALAALTALTALATTALSPTSASAFGAGHFAQGTNRGAGFGGAPNRTVATPSLPTRTAGTAAPNGQAGFQRKLASNGTQLNTTHALADPCSGVGAPKTCFLNQGKGVGGTGGSAAALGAKTTPVQAPTTPTPAAADPCSGVGAPKTCFLNQGKGVDGTGGSAAALGAKTTTNIGSPVLVPTTAPALPSSNKGSGGNTNANTTTGNGTTPTGGTGSGGNANANNGNGQGGQGGWKPGMPATTQASANPPSSGWTPGSQGGGRGPSAPGQMASNQPCGYGCGNGWKWHRPYGSGTYVETVPVYAAPVYTQAPVYQAPVYTQAPVYQAPAYQAPVQTTYAPPPAQTTYAPAPQTYVAPTAPTYAAAPSAEPCTCLTKSYTQDGSVMFADNCTKETAMAAPAGWQQGQTAPQQPN
jgi:hypothetical protein